MSGNRTSGAFQNEGYQLNQVFNEMAGFRSVAESLRHGGSGAQPLAEQAGNHQEARLEMLIGRLLELEAMLTAVGNTSPAMKPSAAADADCAQSLLKSVAKLQRERDEATTSLEQRFGEIVVLTRLLEEARSHANDAVAAVAALKRQPGAAKATAGGPQHVEGTHLLHVELVKRLQDAVDQTLLQKLRQSWRKLRRSPVFAGERRRALRTLGKTFEGGLGQFARCAKLLQASVLFDADWYVARYPDVAASKVMPDLHYLKYGAAEGRDPGPLFSTTRYLDLYPDVAASRINPLIHYISHGLKERRVIEPAQVN